MAGIFSNYKDKLLDFLDTNLKTKKPELPLEKTGEVFNNYTRGDFIVVGGRKTSGKSSFILNNYVISPIQQKIDYVKTEDDFDLKIIYINTRKSLEKTVDKMIVNFTANKLKGSKVSIPAIYGLKHSGRKVTTASAKKFINIAMNTFERFITGGHLNISAGRKSLDEIEYFIQQSMSEYGSFDESDNFIYDKKHEGRLPFIVVDDVTGIHTDTSVGSVRNDAAHAVAIKLKALAKLYNAVVVVGVPSYNPYNKSTVGHTSSIDEVAPYGIYADRCVILHNPLETHEKRMLGYDIENFICNKTGASYIRTAYIASNYMGPSGFSFSYFMYPENGYMMELLPSEEILSMQKYYDIVTDSGTAVRRKKPARVLTAEEKEDAEEAKKDNIQRADAKYV